MITPIDGRKHMKTFEDKKLAKLLADRKQIADEMNAITDQITELESERNKKALKLQKFKEKIMEYVKKNITPQMELTEFEEIAEIKIIPSGVEVTKLDRLEEFKKMYREKNAK